MPITQDPARFGRRAGPGIYKRWFDLSILTAAHLALLPLWLLLWTTVPLAIWLQDRGPVFYRQQRPGRNGVPFTLLKFRSMVPDAHLKGLAWTTERDPRITPLGRILRRTALDELPSVINIWRGDMSLVGPRALPLAEQRLLEEQIPGFELRLEVRPGLTGLAQVYDQTDDARTKLRLDLEYAHCMSPWLDMKLLFLSVRNTLAARWDKRSGKQAQQQSNKPGDQT